MLNFPRIPVFALLCVLLVPACSTVPIRDESAVSVEEARAWLSRFCSKGPRAMNGSLVFKAKTREFKGQHPGNLRFEPGGGFTLEVTHILGGTLMRLTSDGLTYALEIPAKPRLNRKEETRYLGIELPILRGLLLGDLPCPLSGKDAESVEVSGATIRLSSGPWIWVYSRTSRGGEKVPFQVELLPAEGGVASFVLSIEEWDSGRSFAPKAKLTTPEGELKWVWRSRSL
jgi:hypothetical protein